MGEINLKFKPRSLTWSDEVRELANQRGVSHISFVVRDSLVIIGAFGSEYLRFIDAEVDNLGVSEVSFRVPTSVVKSAFGYGSVTMKSEGSILEITKTLTESQRIVIHIPLEYDYLEDRFMEFYTESMNCTSPAISLKPLLGMKNLLKLGKNGVKIEDGRAFTAGNGYIVFKGFDQGYRMVISPDCMSAISDFIRNKGPVQLLTVNGYILAKRDNSVFGWKKSREFTPDTWEEFRQAVPVFQGTANIELLQMIFSQVSIGNKSNAVCKLDFISGDATLSIGTQSEYTVSLSFSGEGKGVFHVPALILSQIIGSMVLGGSIVNVSVYESFICLNVDSTYVLISGDYDEYSTHTHRFS